VGSLEGGKIGGINATGQPTCSEERGRWFLNLEGKKKGFYLKGWGGVKNYPPPRFPEKSSAHGVESNGVVCGSRTVLVALNGGTQRCEVGGKKGERS